jgi:hypothetical protein
MSIAAVERAKAYALGVMARLIAAGATHEEEPQIGAYDEPTPACVKTPAGAWAIVLTKAQLTPQESWAGDWRLDGELSLVHVDTEGKVALAAIETTGGAWMPISDFSNAPLFAPKTPNCCSFTFQAGLEEMQAFDFDGDAEPELHVGASLSFEGDYVEWDELFTFKAGRVERYPPATLPLPFREMRDETGDGRPDLTMSQELPAADDCYGFGRRGFGLAFLAHSRAEGGFSTDDAEARAFAKKQCPSPPPASCDDFHDLLCARLWGASEAELVRQVRACFVSWDCAAQQANLPQHANAREDYELLLNAAAARVPFTLR